MKLKTIAETQNAPVDSQIMLRKVTEYIKSMFGISSNLGVYGPAIHGDFELVDIDRSKYEEFEKFVRGRGWHISNLAKRSNRWTLLVAPILSRKPKWMDVAGGGTYWHATSASKVEMILKKGLIPKGKKDEWGANDIKGLLPADHPDRVLERHGGYDPRIYFATSIEGAIRMACSLRRSQIKDHPDDGIAVLQATLPKHVKIRVDPEDSIDETFVYTVTHVKPEWIEPVVTIRNYIKEIYQSTDVLDTARHYEGKE